MSNTATPITRTLPLSADELLCALLSLDATRHVRILDSCGHRNTDARYLIAGFDPFEMIEAYGDELHIQTQERSSSRRLTRIERGSILTLLDNRLSKYVVKVGPSTLPVSGACIATFSYDLVRRFERLRSRKPKQNIGPVEPDATLAFYDTLLVHDYKTGETKVVSVAGPMRLDDACDSILKSQAEQRLLSTDIAPFNTAVSNFSRDDYIRAVERIKEHIFAGDIYQANLTQQFTCSLGSELMPKSIFLNLRHNHPASFAAFIRRREDIVISASPERFLRVEASNDRGNQRRVEAWPIKGTRPRGKDRTDDGRLREELLSSEKDWAENVMIVDLLRNDLGRVCEYGSVKVDELCAIQEHPTLFHLVSKVSGRLREEVTAGELLRATFPCGSITGAPKIRAMEIIDAVETIPRGLSMGAIGYFSFNGAIDLNVAIRTMTIQGNIARFNVGGGIVADSDPQLEYEESLVKAHALLQALKAEVKES